MKTLFDELSDQAAKRGIAVPTQRTLDRYGFKPVDWLVLLSMQGWRCAVCQKSKATWNTDHEHVPGWSRMPPERRRIYVRGVLCWHCNRNKVPSNMQSGEAQRVVDYLSAYEERRSIAFRADPS